MKRMMLALSVMVLLGSSARAADVGVSISIGQPGFYGQIDIGDFPRPTLVYAQPVIIHPVRPGIVVQPVYLHVPPGHAKKWKNYCGRYDACGRPVYFVQDRWYNDVYVPRYQERQGKGDHGHDKGNHGKDKGKGKGKHD